MKGRTLSWGALERDPPAVGFDRPFGDGQAQSGAATVSRARFLHAIEPIEEPRDVFWWNAWPTIGDFDKHVTPGFSSDADMDRAASW